MHNYIAENIGRLQ